VLAALDADSDGSISSTEINTSAAALRTLDGDGDGSLIAPEVLPDPVANEATVYFSHLDTDRDSRISYHERAGASDEGTRELLDHADRNQDGVVDGKELANELRLRAARQQALDNAVRSAFGGAPPN
jgi:Ca2+-binding EF-hand superfamily protein